MKAVIFQGGSERIEIDFDEDNFKFGLCRLTAYDGAREIVVMYDYTDYVIDTLLMGLSFPKILPHNLLNKLSLLFDKYCFDLWHTDSFEGKDLTEQFSVFPGFYFYQIENRFEFEAGNISQQAGDSDYSYVDWQNWLKDNFYLFRIALTTEDIISIKERLVLLRKKSKYPI